MVSNGKFQISNFKFWHGPLLILLLVIVSALAFPQAAGDFYTRVVRSNSSLSLYSGGTNQNITLTPSGTGYTILNGNVGMGTTSPAAALDLRDTNKTAASGNANFFAFTTDAQAADIGGTFSLGGNITSSSSATPFAYIWGKKENGLSGDQSGYLAFGTRSNSVPHQSEWMRITSGGYVGIGTPTPSSLFSVGSSSQFQVNSSGLVAQYKNVATIGNGMPSFTGQSSQTNFSAAVNSTNILAASIAATQLYRVGYAMWQTASGSGGTCGTNATATVTLAWTDPASQAQTKAESALNLPPTLAPGAYQQDEIRVPAKASTPLTYSIAWANGNCTVQPTASILLYAEEMN